MRKLQFFKHLTAMSILCSLSFNTITLAAEYSGLNYQFVYDTDYYYEHNSDVAAAIGYHSSLLYKHFLQYGMREGRIASNAFNVQIYQKYNGDLQEAFGEQYANYYTHFLRYGKDENRKITGCFHNGLDYSLVFNDTYYYNHNPDVANAFGTDSNLLWQHFIADGIQEGRTACSDFDVLAYKAANQDLQEAFGDHLEAYFDHYIRYGQYENRTTKFSGSVYYKNMNFADIYNKEYYLANNPDVEMVLGHDDQTILNHFVTYGMAEGRLSNGSFHVNTYKNNYSDLQEAFGDDMKSYYLHYINYGKSEGRNASTHIHNYSLISHTDATCAKEATYTYQCACGNTYTDTTPALEHNWKLISDNGANTKTLIYECTTCKRQYTAANPNYKPISIACWGDSMTLGQYGNGVTYPNTLEQLTGIKTYNLGVSGETSIQILTRQGAISMVIEEDIYLPKNGSAEFSLISTYTEDAVDLLPNFHDTADYSGYNYSEYFDNMCYINGQAYEIQCIDGTHYIIDSYNADCDSPYIYIPAGTTVSPKASIDRADDILILEIGSNGGWGNDYDTLIEQYHAMINYAGCDNYIILGDTDDPGDSIDANQDEFEEDEGMNDTLWEAALREEFGSHFLNVRTYLIENGLNDNHLTATSEDLERASYGKISLQLRTSYDNTHLSAAGYYSKGVAVYLKGQALGYW